MKLIYYIFFNKVLRAKICDMASCQFQDAQKDATTRPQVEKSEDDPELEVKTLLSKENINQRITHDNSAECASKNKSTRLDAINIGLIIWGVLSFALLVGVIGYLVHSLTNPNCPIQSDKCEANSTGNVASFLQQENTTTVARLIREKYNKSQQVALLREFVRDDTETHSTFSEILSSGNSDSAHSGTEGSGDHMNVFNTLVEDDEDCMDIIETLAGDTQKSMVILNKLLGDNDATKVITLDKLLTRGKIRSTILVKLLREVLGEKFPEYFNLIEDKHEEFTQLLRVDRWFITASNWDAAPLALKIKIPLSIVVVEETESTITVPFAILDIVLGLGEKLRGLGLHFYRNLYKPDNVSAKRDGDALQSVIKNNR